LLQIQVGLRLFLALFEQSTMFCSNDPGVSMKDSRMADGTYDGTAATPASVELQSIVRGKIENLRARLLDSSRRNPLVQVPFRQNSSSLIRFVDEQPAVLAENLSNKKSMCLAPLPPIDESLPDEQTDEFLSAFGIARAGDEIFDEASAKLDPTDPDYAQKELDLERGLKDRVRVELGLPERQTKKNPSLAAHAAMHGISSDYILPLPSENHDDGRHEDMDIQTLLLPERLDRVGRSLHDKGHTYERETGVNVLHAVFGLLEWNEPGSSRDPARSPLLLLEVKMAKKKSPEGTEYHICGENELFLNTTLAQILSSEFGFKLPHFEGGCVEEYMAQIADMAPKGWHWAVRREALVGAFPSSRIAMYHDLDPENGSVMHSPLIEKMLASAGGDGASYAEVYDTDAPDIERRVPHLIMDADASQFSALVDVATGSNIAIEGPPGSGKSQTIVNLIASAMAEGKKVLFVAEKLTALDVVRNRLEAANLGEFILPLQAGRGSRDEVFKSLDERLALEHPGSGAHASHQARYETLVERREDMRAYLDMLGAQVGATGMTVHDALGLAIKSAEHLDGLPRDIRRLRLAGAERIDSETLTAIKGDTQMVVDRLDDADQIAALWREAGKAPLRTDEAEDIAVDLAALACGIIALRADLSKGQLNAFLPPDAIRAKERVTIDALNAISEHSDCEPDLTSSLLNDVMRQSAIEICDIKEAVLSSIALLSDALTDPDADNVDAIIADAAELAAQYEGKIDPADLFKKISTLEQSCERITTCRDLAEALPARWAETVENAGTTLSDLRLDIEMLLRAPSPVLARRQADDSRTTAVIAREAALTQRALAADCEGIRSKLRNASEHNGSALGRASEAIASAGIFRIFSSSYKSAWALYSEALGDGPKQSRAEAASALREYANWAERRDSFASDTRIKSCLGDMFLGWKSDPELLDALANFHDTAKRISQGDERLCYALETAPLDPLRAFSAHVDMPAITLTRLKHDLDDAVAAADRIKADRQSAISLCLSFCRREKIEADMIEFAAEARQNIENADERIARSCAADLIKHRSDTDVIRAACLLAKSLLDLPRPEAGVDLLRKGGGALAVREAEQFFAALNGLIREATSIAAEIELSCVDTEVETAALYFFAARLEDIQDASGRSEGLVERARLLRAIAALDKRGLRELTAWVQTDDGANSRDALPNIANAIFARSLTDYVEAHFGRILDAKDGADLDRLRGDIAKIDREMSNLSRGAIREKLVANSRPPTGNGIGKVGTYTDMSLIRHEMNKKRNRVGVRELTTRAGAALIDLKPCWMMSPLAVAQYLNGDFKFDLVVIDEASQMTPENALGAIMRARQVVVVGDTKQLPPSTFFSKVLDDSDDDEDLRTDSESILDMANTTFTPVRQLRWHYRSRHPSLIAISNKMIYDDQLTIFPAARDGDPELGVSLIEVEGQYRKGRNVPEARAIVEGAIEHMRSHPDRSLGLASMNKDQTELIMSEFERERARHPHVDAYIERWSEQDDGLEEFFVKNLETIQGDERDVIMISTLYGPEAETGKVYQRFGPVNSVHGHRRLNVLFSRAKEKIVTYSSMKPTDIQTEGKAHGVAMLRAWLEFSHTGKMHEIATNRRSTDSPFEDFVIAQIEAAGFEAVPQVGASGYRIDIGVRHPDWEYGYILAVECDGAPYHSSKSSRDRDRLRQQVLEGLGWKFHRIWSTDWFRDPRRQIERLRDALNGALVSTKEDDLRRISERAAATIRAREALLRRQEEEKNAATDNAVAPETRESASPRAQQGSLFGEQPQRRSEATEMPIAKPIEVARPSLSAQATARIEEWSEEQGYDCFNRTATTRKRGFYWLGFLDGVAASDGIESGEPEALIAEAIEVDKFFGGLGVDTISSGLARTISECDTLLESIQQHADDIEDSLDNPELGSDKDVLNEFLGFCAGIASDGVITSQEARKIHARFHEEPSLAKEPMFASLRWAVDGALADDVLDEVEAEEIREWIAVLVTDGYTDTGISSIGGVAASTDPITDPDDILFDNRPLS
jgi:very-short-patch-repair endonuclease/RecA/RadA recombinase